MIRRCVQSLLIPLLFLVLVLVLVLVMSGCNSSSGGGGAGTGDNNNSGGNAGNNGSPASGELKAVATARKVMGRAYLDGSASYQTIASYQWRQTAGTTVPLVDPSSALTEFPLPTVASAELLTFELTVTHADGTTHSQLLSLEVTPNDEPAPRTTLVGPTVVGEELLFPELDNTVEVSDLVKVGDYVYIAAGENGVRYVNVADPRVPEVAGTIGAIDRVSDLALNDSGDVLYIADHEGLRVVDVSDPAQPVVLTSLLSFIVDHDSYAVQASGNHLYAAGSDLVVYNVSDPGSPSIDFRSELPFNNTAIADMVVADDLAYFLLSFGGLRILDISAPDQLELVGSYSIDDNANDFWLSGQHAYIATRDQGVIVVDVSDPSLPAYVGSMTEDHTIFPNRARSIEVFDDIAYVGSDLAFQTWDVANPAQATYLGEVASGGEALMVDGQFAYIASGKFVSIVDISRPESVAVVDERADLSELRESASNGFIALDDTMNVVNASDPDSLDAITTALDTQATHYSFLENDTLYVYGSDLKVFDVSDIDSPSLTKTYSLDDVNMQLSYPNLIVDVDDDRLFFLNNRDQVTILSFSNEESLTVTKPDFIGNGYQLLAVDDDIAFVLENDGQYVSAVNFSNPDNLTEVASIEITDRDNAWLGGKALRKGDHLIISGMIFSPGYGLAVIDVSTPTNPELTAYPRETYGPTDNLVILGDLAFHTEGQNQNGYVMIFDLSDPAHPAYTTLSPEGLSRYSVKAAGNTLLVDNHRGVKPTKTHVVDITSLSP